VKQPLVGGGASRSLIHVKQWTFGPEAIR
jgi:hypothetical protein